MYLAIDIGGTKTLLALFSETGDIADTIKFETPQNYQEFLITLQDSLLKLSAKEFAGCAIGCRGRIDRKQGMLVSGGAALDWHNSPLVSDVSAMTSCAVKIENDANLAGLSEALLVQDSYQKAVYITVSSGIGGVFVVNGKIDPDTIDTEPGLTIYEHEGTYQPWEAFASGKAIVEKYGLRAGEITDPAIWKAISENLAVGIVNLSAILTPDVLIIGGGVGSHLSKFIEPLEQSIRELGPSDLIKIPPLLQAQKPEEAVIYGCFEIAKTS